MPHVSTTANGAAAARQPAKDDERAGKDDIKCLDDKAATTLRDVKAVLLEQHKDERNRSLMKKHFLAQWDEIRELGDLRSEHGATLMHCVKSGVHMPSSKVGIYAGDASCYRVFRPLFDVIISDYHSVTVDPVSLRITPASVIPDWGRPEDIDTLGTIQHVVSSRIRLARNIKGYPFVSCISKQQLLEIERAVLSALDHLPESLRGSYYPVADMDGNTRDRLVSEHLLFQQNDRYLSHAGAYSHYPWGRGVYISKDKSFVVWINEEDHIRVMCIHRGGNLAHVYSNIIQAMTCLDQCGLSFAQDNARGLGYLTFCPTNLGTTMRASVHVKLPSLLRDVGRLKVTARGLGLQIRGTMGENTEVIDGVVDVSNYRRLGMVEYQVLTTVYHGVEELLKIEAAAAGAANQ